jgi:hypothetical protein
VQVVEVPDCVTVTVRPAIVSVPLRGEAVELAVTLKVTAPLPLPDAPLAIVIHPLLLAAVQLQPLVVVTFEVALPALAASV